MRQAKADKINKMQITARTELLLTMMLQKFTGSQMGGTHPNNTDQQRITHPEGRLIY